MEENGLHETRKLIANQEYYKKLAGINIDAYFKSQEENKIYKQALLEIKNNPNHIGIARAIAQKALTYVREAEILTKKEAE